MKRFLLKSKLGSIFLIIGIIQVIYFVFTFIGPISVNFTNPLEKLAPKFLLLYIVWLAAYYYIGYGIEILYKKIKVYDKKTKLKILFIFLFLAFAVYWLNPRVKLLRIKTTETTAQLSWINNQISKPIKFEIHWNEDPNQNHDGDRIKAPASNHKIINLKPNTKYHILVAPVKNDGAWHFPVKKTFKMKKFCNYLFKK